VKRFVLLFLAGCGARTELYAYAEHDAGAPDAHVHDAAKDVIEEDVVDAGPDVILSPFCEANDAGEPPPSGICKVQAHVGTVVTQSGCYVDVVVHDGDTGTVEYACDGTSTWARATFDGTTFLGAVQGTFVNICIGTTYPWNDGPACDYHQSTWASAQRIYGDVTSGELTFVYDEKQIAGMSCDIACTAQGTIAVQ
jgi:hypothetical protein